MGMFDSLYDAEGQEWQTKAFSRDLVVFSIRDEMPTVDGLDAYQVEVIGGRRTNHRWSLATVRGGLLVDVDVAPDPMMPRVDYSGRILAGDLSDAGGRVEP